MRQDLIPLDSIFSELESRTAVACTGTRSQAGATPAGVRANSFGFSKLSGCPIYRQPELIPPHQTATVLRVLEDSERAGGCRLLATHFMEDRS